MPEVEVHGRDGPLDRRAGSIGRSSDRRRVPRGADRGLARDLVRDEEVDPGEQLPVDQDLVRLPLGTAAGDANDRGVDLATAPGYPIDDLEDPRGRSRMARGSNVAQDVRASACLRA